MIEVIPAILPKDYEELKNEIALVRFVVPIVQIDICDGVFAPTMTWPINDDSHFQKILDEEEGMPFWEDIDFELDLMVSDAVPNFDIYTKLGPRRVIFHIEAVGDLNAFKDFLEGIDVYIRDSLQIGIALNPSTPIEDIFPLTSCIDFVQLMGNDKIGYHGMVLDEKIYEKIKILKEKYSDLPIAVDIGVNDKTAPLLVKAGVTKLIIGSAIFNSNDIIGRVEEFKNLEGMTG